LEVAPCFIARTFCHRQRICPCHGSWPLQTLIEKEEILETALRENWLLFFEHDPVNAVSSLVRDAKGVIQALDPRSDLSI
jgi:hypothetical protein